MKAPSIIRTVTMETVAKMASTSAYARQSHVRARAGRSMSQKRTGAS
jgi:hypothetical protein